MALITYVSRTLPAISAAWLNAIEALRFTVFQEATTQQDAVKALIPAWARTSAEIAAAVVPSDYGRPPVCIIDITRYGGAPGAADNTAAMNRAKAVLAQQKGGVIMFPVPGEWRMNWVCDVDGITLMGPGGSGEFDRACIRPFSLLSPPITIGTGATSQPIRYCRLINCHISGTDDVGGANSGQAAHSAPAALKLFGVAAFRADNCVFYNGLITVDIRPSATLPVTDINFVSCTIRNDITDSANARCIFGTRLVDPGYYTDVYFIGCKFNGPKAPAASYFAEFDGTTVGLQGRFIGGYADISAGRGILLKGAATFHPSDDFDLDPGTTGAVVVETNQAISDVTRVVAGNFTHGGQSIKFAAGVTVAIPAEADTFFYQPRIYRAFMGPSTFWTISDANQYSTTTSLSYSVSPNLLTFDGAEVVFNNGIKLSGTDVVQEFFESDQGADAKLWWQRVNTSNMTIQTRTDAAGAGKIGLSISRTGTTISQTELGNATDLPPNRLNGHLQITDGVTAPGTVAGFGAIYIDSADGDLKIKFGDGTVKTIVVDT